MIAGIAVAALFIAGIIWLVTSRQPSEDARVQKMIQQAEADQMARLKASEVDAERREAAVEKRAQDARDAEAKALKNLLAAQNQPSAQKDAARQKLQDASKTAAVEAKAAQEAEDTADQLRAQKDAAEAKPSGVASAPAARPLDGEKWENTLGMTFVPAGTPGILVSVYDTRVRDFTAFADATGYQPAKCYTLDPNGKWMEHGDWKNLGFSQSPDHPVAGISWEDAVNFCRWLTVQERKEGKLGEAQKYRLPTDDEWSTAAGMGTYPWGEAWPPPAGAGNFAAEGDHLPITIAGYRDGQPHTSPVGQFKPNPYGLYDMSGNVWQWVDTYYRADMNTPDILHSFPEYRDDRGGDYLKVVRGGSWDVGEPLHLRTACHRAVEPGAGNSARGFRCVLVIGP